MNQVQLAANTIRTAVSGILSKQPDADLKGVVQQLYGRKNEPAARILARLGSMEAENRIVGLAIQSYSRRILTGAAKSG